jgi:hypothetical protein
MRVPLLELNYLLLTKHVDGLILWITGRMIMANSPQRSSVWDLKVLFKSNLSLETIFTPRISQPKSG